MKTEVPWLFSQEYVTGPDELNIVFQPTLIFIG
jgi:hypothetical protein